MQDQQNEKSSAIAMVYQKAKNYIERNKEFNAHSNNTLRDELIEALNAGDFETSKQLIQAGANVNAISKSGESILFHVNSPAAQRFLIEAGADLNQPVLSTGLVTGLSSFKKGETPAHYAVRTRDFELLADLLQAGAKTDVENADGLTVRGLAAKQGVLKQYLDALNQSERELERRAKSHVAMSPTNTEEVARKAQIELDSGVKKAPPELPGLVRKDFQWFSPDDKAQTRPVIIDRGSEICCASENAIDKAVELAKQKGWTSLKLEGNPEQLGAAWLACQLQGVKTEGYTPTTDDIAKLNERQGALKMSKPETPTLNVGAATEVKTAVTEIKSAAENRTRTYESPWLSARRAGSSEMAANVSAADQPTEQELETAMKTAAILNALKERFQSKINTTEPKKGLEYTGKVLESWDGIGFLQSQGGGHVRFHAHPNPPPAGITEVVMYQPGMATPLVGNSEIRVWREEQNAGRGNSSGNRTAYEPTQVNFRGGR